MKINPFIFVVVTAFAIFQTNNGHAANKDEACETEFREYMAGGAHEIYPYEVNSVDIRDGNETRGHATVIAKDFSFSYLDGSSSRSLIKGQKVYTSSDKGKTWSLLMEMKKEFLADGVRRGEEQAASAREITCTDAVEYEGKTYRLLQGVYTNASDKKSLIYQKFYVSDTIASAPTWAIRMSDSIIVGKPSQHIEIKTASGDDVDVPEITLGE